MTKKIKRHNTWTRMSDSDGSRHASAEYDQVAFMDYHCSGSCNCGGRFEYRPTVGCMMCVKCGEIKIEC